MTEYFNVEDYKEHELGASNINLSNLNLTGELETVGISNIDYPINTTANLNLQSNAKFSMASGAVIGTVLTCTDNSGNASWRDITAFGDIQDDINTLNIRTMNMSYSQETTTIGNNVLVPIGKNLKVGDLTVYGGGSQVLFFDTELSNYPVLIPEWCNYVEIVCQGAGGSGGGSPFTSLSPPSNGNFYYHISGAGGGAGGISKTCFYRFQQFISSTGTITTQGLPSTSPIPDYLYLTNSLGGSRVASLIDGKTPSTHTFVKYGVNRIIVCCGRKGSGGKKGFANIISGTGVFGGTGGWGTLAIGGDGAIGSNSTDLYGKQGNSATSTAGLQYIAEGSAGGSSGGGLVRTVNSYTTVPFASGGTIGQNTEPSESPNTNGLSSGYDWGIIGSGFCSGASSSSTFNSTANDAGDGYYGSGGSSAGCSISGTSAFSGKGGDGYIIITFR